MNQPRDGLDNEYSDSSTTSESLGIFLVMRDCYKQVMNMLGCSLYSSLSLHLSCINSIILMNEALKPVMDMIMKTVIEVWHLKVWGIFLVVRDWPLQAGHKLGCSGRKRSNHCRRMWTKWVSRCTKFPGYTLPRWTVLWVVQSGHRFLWISECQRHQHLQRRSLLHLLFGSPAGPGILSKKGGEVPYMLPVAPIRVLNDDAMATLEIFSVQTRSIN